MYQCLTHCWHMFIRPLVFSVSSLCLVTVCGSIDPISTWGSLKFHLILNLKANKEGKRKQDNRTGNWWWISKVLIAPCISSCCPCVRHLTRQASLSRSSIKSKVRKSACFVWRAKWGQHGRNLDLSMNVLTPTHRQGIHLKSLET